MQYAVVGPLWSIRPEKRIAKMKRVTKKFLSRLFWTFVAFISGWLILGIAMAYIFNWYWVINSLIGAICRVID